MEQKTKIIAEKGKQEITITREFDLPIELLFKAYTEAEFLEQWMGLKVIKLVNKNHGSFEFETIREGRVVFKANGTIHQIKKNQNITRTFEMDNLLDGIRIEFLDFESITDKSSKLTMQMIYKSEKHRAEQLKLPFANGLNMAHNRLQELFNNLNHQQNGK
ncbi:ATPase [Pedobacter psychrophilus]|uniref:ATPase n=1 Tax=Pedobacter psychrophilus TaxID=1826909 RepID=A0A179DLK5_9SPHI|nr:SRPBCC domain-containing protein [Pedobacter psychrophilus]OAQ41945.1 ATPase [Pedobacter psychrophilus]